MLGRSIRATRRNSLPFVGMVSSHGPLYEYMEKGGGYTDRDVETLQYYQGGGPLFPTMNPPPPPPLLSTTSHTIRTGSATLYIAE